MRESRRRTDPEMAVRIDEGPRANQIYVDVTPRPLPTIFIVRHNLAPPTQPEHKDSDIGSDVTPPAADNDAEEDDTSPPDHKAVMPTDNPLTNSLAPPEPERHPSGMPENETAVIPGGNSDFPSTIAPPAPVDLPQ